MSLNICKKRYRTKFFQKNSQGDLYCYKCKDYKSKDNFDSSPQESDVFYREGKDKRCKACKHNQYLKRRENSRGRKDIDRLLLERYHALKDRALKGNLEVSVSLKDLKKLWEKQKGRCAISNVNMSYIFNSGRIPTNVSVDRINSKLGYTINNFILI